MTSDETRLRAATRMLREFFRHPDSLDETFHPKKRAAVNEVIEAAREEGRLGRRSLGYTDEDETQVHLPKSDETREREPMGDTAAYEKGFRDGKRQEETTKSEETYPECSGDPTSCPENEGYGCCKPNPQSPMKSDETRKNLLGCGGEELKAHEAQLLEDHHCLTQEQARKVLDFFHRASNDESMWGVMEDVGLIDGGYFQEWIHEWEARVEKAKP